MAETKTRAREPGELLLRQLKRLTTKARALKVDDRAQLIALVDDLETVRLGLQRECARLDEQLRLAARRVMAFNAYARNGRPARVPHRRGTRDNGATP
jgi:hypothetical protein